MNEVRARRLAWSIWALVPVLGALNAWLVLSVGVTTDYEGLTGDPVWVGLDAGSGLVFAVGAALGALVAARKPRNPVGWLLLAGVLGFMATFTVESLATDLRFVPPVSERGAAWAGLVWTLAGPAALGSLLAMLWLFPTGTLLTTRWRLAFGLVLLLVAVVVAGHLLVPGPMADYYLGAADPIGNPLGIAALEPLAGSMPTIEGLLFTPAVLLTLVAFIARFRRSRDVEQQQLKWLLYAIVVGTAGALLWFSLGGLWGILGELGFEIMLPAAVAIAMFRYRLYDIDRLISRTVAWALVTATLAGVYLALVLLLSLAIQPLNLESDLAVAGSVLVVAALFNPVRRRTQVLVDRRFNRARFDSERRVAAFADQLRDEVDLDALTNELAQVVGDTMQPTQVSVYLHAGEGARS